MKVEMKRGENYQIVSACPDAAGPFSRLGTHLLGGSRAHRRKPSCRSRDDHRPRHPGCLPQRSSAVPASASPAPPSAVVRGPARRGNGSANAVPTSRCVGAAADRWAAAVAQMDDPGIRTLDREGRNCHIAANVSDCPRAFCDDSVCSYCCLMKGGGVLPSVRQSATAKRRRSKGMKDRQCDEARRKRKKPKQRRSGRVFM